MSSKTPLLDTIRGPKDVGALSPEQLRPLCDELRQDLLTVVCETGGHLGSTLGVIELTVALHHVFNAPHDKIVWDVGHQAYGHKILTGRRDRMPTIRKDGGISGFLKRNESPYDAFGAGHAGTSISAALGMREAFFHQKHEAHKVVAVIGDASIATGMAFEALNHAGALPRNLVVVLNDNEMSIAPGVGALKAFLRRRLSGQLYNALKRDVKAALNLIPGGDRMIDVARRVDERVKALVTPGVLFEGLGFDYIGPIDGHDVDKVVEALSLAKEVVDRPVLLHALTVKGKGYAPAEAHAESMHGVVPFDLATGKSLPAAKKPAAPSYTNVFGDTMIALAEQDPRVVAITAGMPSGTGLTRFGTHFPDRFYDVGIAEQHAVTFAAGLSCEGMRPVAAIYSTFLQRAFDQCVHDVAIQELPVTFALDRGGIAGADGATHHGWGDLTWLRSIPNFTVMVPKDENEMRRMLKTSLALPGPAAVRYPRGEGEGVELDEVIEPLPVGKGEVVFGELSSARFGIAAVGNMVSRAVKAAEALAVEGIDVCVVNARFVKPLDAELLGRLASLPGGLVTVEENTVIGGFGAGVLEMLQERGIWPAQMSRLGLPDRFIHHGSPDKLRAELGIDAAGIANAIRRMAAVQPIRRVAKAERA